jgi:beta-galactosidase
MKPALGVCYYPEQWPERLWASDARRMAEAGITYVRIGEFAWGKIEPEPGKIRLDWLTRAMDALHQRGLKVVVGTPTAAPPRWLVAKMPGMLPVDAEGRVRKFGSRRHYCFSHKGYRTECARIATLVASAVKRHPGLAAWQIDNEYGCHDTTLSYSQAALFGFREWLRTRYGAIEALNSAWGNVFWSMEYRDFDEIELPNLTPAEASPTHWLDFRRYSSDQVVAFNKVQADILRSITPNVPIATNYMAGMTAFDHFRLGANLDFASWDSYPVGQISSRGGSPERKARYARQGDPDLQAFHHDLYRTVGKGRFWVMEQQPGPVNWGVANPDPLPGMVRLWTWEALAHGAEAVCYFRWRQAPFAQEQMHSGLVRPDDKPAPGLAEARQVASELSALDLEAPGKADCAIVYDYESAWAWQIEPQAEGFSHFQAAAMQYRQLRKLGLDVDIISAETADLAGYKLVFVPALFAWTDALTEALSRANGLVVIGPRSGSKTKDFHIPAELPPDLPSQLLDVKVVRVDSLPDYAPVPIKGGGQVFKWRDKIETRAEVHFEAEDGWPVLVGRERYFYLAALLDDAAHAKVTRKLVDLAGLKTLDLPPGVRTRKSGATTFVFNYGLETHDLEALGFRAPFGLDGAKLGPAGVARVGAP